MANICFGCALTDTCSNNACPERGPVRPKQYQEASPKCAQSVRFWYVKEHFGRRRSNAPGSSDPSPDTLLKAIILLFRLIIRQRMCESGSSCAEKLVILVISKSCVKWELKCCNYISHTVRT